MRGRSRNAFTCPFSVSGVLANRTAWLHKALEGPVCATEPKWHVRKKKQTANTVTEKHTEMTVSSDATNELECKKSKGHKAKICEKGVEDA